MISNLASLKELLLSASPLLAAIVLFLCAPNAVVGFYRRFGVLGVDRLGPGFVRGLGVVGLTFMAMIVVVVATGKPSQ